MGQAFYFWGLRSLGMHDIPNRPPRVGAQILNMISVRFDGFSAPPAGAEQAIQTLCLTTHII